MKKAAFTLAEVLITLAVIGVVAALTIPTLLTNINDKVRNTRITTINTKLRQGTDKLMLMGHINGYETTEDFMQALSQHMKILAYCSADKLTECYPYDTINVDGEEEGVNVADLTTPEAFGLDKEEYSNPVSFITGDGVPYIIAYKKNCAIDENNGRSNSIGCIAGLYDWNGSHKPNKVISAGSSSNAGSADIQFLGNVTKLGTKTGEDVKVSQADGDLNPVISDSGKTYTKFKYVGLDYCGEDGNQKCNGNTTTGLNTCTDTTYDDRGSRNTSCSNNKWAAAKKKCEDIGMELPSKNALVKVYKQKTSNTVLNERLRAELMLSGAFWSSEPLATEFAYYVSFGSGDTSYYFSAMDLWVICLGE